MNHNFSRTSLGLLISSMLMLIVPSAYADETDTLSFTKSSKIASYNSSLTNGSTQSLAGVTLTSTSGYTTLSFSTNNGTQAPTYVHNTFYAVALYKTTSSSSEARGNTMEIAAAGASLKQVVITFTESSYFPSDVSLSFSSGSAIKDASALTVTWTPSEATSSVTLENNNSNNWRITQVCVTYETVIAWSASEASVTLGSSSYSLPTLLNPDSLEVTYSSSATTVATIDSVGDISLLDVGTTIISATSTATDSIASVTVSYTLTVASAAKEEAGDTDDGEEEEDPDFYLVTSTDDLAEGDEITFVCESYSVCIGSVRSSGNNFAAVSVEISDHTLTLPEAGTSYILGLHRDGHWYFMAADSSYYLCAPGTDNNNWLQPTTTLDEYAHAKIAIDSESYNAAVKFQGSTNQNYNDSLLYNYYNTLFACYGANTHYTQVPVQIYKKVTQAIDVTISSVGYATLYYSAYNLQVHDSVTAYTVTTNEDKTTATLTALTAAEDDGAAIIPAGEPVVLFSQEPINQSQAITYSFPIVSSYDGSKSATNELVGTDTLVTLNESNTTYYILSTGGENNDVVAFYWQDDSGRGASVSLDAHKCCLPIVFGSNSQTRSLSISVPSSEDDDETDAISNINADAPVSAPSGIYSLSGQRMRSADNLPAGIYVIDGKKVMVR